MNSEQRQWLLSVAVQGLVVAALGVLAGVLVRPWYPRLAVVMVVLAVLLGVQAIVVVLVALRRSRP
jgi:1,4-dihydroxy-2-naphthoate octaprenyltransferase